MDGIWRVRVAVLPSVKRFSPRTLLDHLKLLSALEWSLRSISGGAKGRIQVARVDLPCRSWGL